MAKRPWTDEQRAAFGAKMAAARAAKVAPTPEEGPVMATEKKFAGREDVPAGVRPIAQREFGGRTVDLSELQGLTQAPDTGYAATGAAIEVSGDVIGASGSQDMRSTAPDMGAKNVGAVMPGTLFSDQPSANPAAMAIQASKVRSGGAADPTGLPCTCAMPTWRRGQDASITWCTLCGGERDGKARPENALRAQMGSVLDQTGVSLSIEAIVERAADRVLAAIDYELIAASVVAKLTQAASANKS
jgi:hypothetical protein